MLNPHYKVEKLYLKDKSKICLGNFCSFVLYNISANKLLDLEAACHLLSNYILDPYLPLNCPLLALELLFLSLHLFPQPMAVVPIILQPALGRSALT